MKVLIMGSSGSGKTYLSNEFKKRGFNAFDADEIEGLHGWYNWKKEKVKFPHDAGKEFMDNHEFLWSRDELEKFLIGQREVYVFGMSGNISEMKDLFDRVYRLKVPESILLERLDHHSRSNPMGKTEYQKKAVLDWEKELDKTAEEMNAILVDGTLPLSELVEQIVRQ